MKDFMNIQMDLKRNEASLKNIIISQGTRYCVIPIENVMIFFYEDRNVFMITKDNEVFLSELDLTSIEQEVSPHFFRINRQVIINHSAIDYFCYGANHTIIIASQYKRLANDLNLTVSKNTIVKFRHWLMYKCLPTAKKDNQFQVTHLRKIM